jgi:hypothetical protein
MSTPPRDPWDQLLVDLGYVLCRVCEEAHRPPECDVDGAGFALARCGCRWVDVEDVGCGDAHEPDAVVFVPRVVDAVLPVDGPL